MEFGKIPKQLKNTLQQQQTIYHLIAARTKHNPDAIAITAPNRIPLTYSCLQTHITEIVATLNAMGLGRGSRVAIVLPNGLEMAVAFLASPTSMVKSPDNGETMQIFFGLTCCRDDRTRIKTTAQKSSHGYITHQLLFDTISK